MLKLEEIFDRQQKLMKKYHEIEINNSLGYGRLDKYDEGDLDSPFFQALLRDLAWRITEELGEAMNCLKNKAWRQTLVSTDEERFKEELIDTFHFFIELLITVGFTPESLTRAYLKKADINKDRQDSGY